MQLPPHLQTFNVNWLAVRTSFDALIAAELEQNPEAPKPDLESLLEGSDADIQPRLDKIAAYTERLDTNHATSPLGHAFFNGKHFDMGDVCSYLYFSLTVEFKTNPGRFMKEPYPTTSNRSHPANIFFSRESRRLFLLKAYI